MLYWQRCSLTFSFRSARRLGRNYGRGRRNSLGGFVVDDGFNDIEVNSVKEGGERRRGMEGEEERGIRFGREKSESWVELTCSVGSGVDSRSGGG